MTTEPLTDTAIQRFIKDHENDDVAELSLKPLPSPDWPRAEILDQIKSRQKAKNKIPLWHNTDNIIWPKPDVIEQCSSQATAAYKARLVQGTEFVDLTAGAGIDTAAFASTFKQGSCVERDEYTAACLRRNLPLLTDTPITIHQQTAEAFVAQMKAVDFAYLDPQRRQSGKRGIMDLAQTEPSVPDLLPLLGNKAATIMIKTSPALDIVQTIEALPHCTNVHVVEWQGQCREVLYILKPKSSSRRKPGSSCSTVEDPALQRDDALITAVQINDEGTPLHSLTFTREQERHAEAPVSEPLAFVYEPSPAFMKAGCFKHLAEEFSLYKLHPHTHLYTSNTPITDFPGRIFQLEETGPVDRKFVKSACPDGTANLFLRNFPEHIDKLRPQLKIKDGGNIYLCACTLHDDRRALLKLSKYEHKS